MLIIVFLRNTFDAIYLIIVIYAYHGCDFVVASLQWHITLKLKTTTMAIQKIVPFLWFDNQAAEAAKFYTTVFKNSKIISENPLVTVFELEGMQVNALNGGPAFKLTEAFSFVINCDTQEEIDYYWNKLTAGGGAESQCGWLKDKFGLSWQVVPAILGKLMNDPERRQRVMDAFMKMKKFDIQKLMEA